MERVALLLEKSQHQAGYPALGFFADWLCAKDMPEFEVSLIDVDGFLAGAGPLCEHSDTKDMPAIMRCHPMDEESYKRVARELRFCGFRLLGEENRLVYEPLSFSICGGEDRVRRYFPNRHGAGHSFGNGPCDGMAPTIAMARDADGYAPGDLSSYLAIGWITASESREIAERFARAKGRTFTGEAFFEQIISCSTCGDDDIPVRWRVFYLDGEPFYSGLIDSDARHVPCDAPKPPDEIVNAFRSLGGCFFYACDFFLVAGGSWMCDRLFDAQMTQVPGGENIGDFYRALAQALAEFPRTPNWIWCLTARVVDENVVGETKKPVRGTRHFAPGTKVYLEAPHWDGRVAAIGVPRYANKRIRVVMSLDRLEGFALERVFDPEVIAALQHPYQTWPYTSMARSELGGTPWDESDESRELIGRLVEKLNGKTEGLGTSRLLTTTAEEELCQLNLLP